MPETNTTGTARSRAGAVRRAVRKQAKARLALSGPSGAGKTWTSLSIAEVIAPGGKYLVIDTEPSDGMQGAAELYADRFDFDTIEWEPPYDPRDLAITITEVGRSHDVVIVDSASHFWRGQGGTLDIADGRFGGWKTATPVQDALVESILRCQAHVICCTRAKQSYEVTGGEGGAKQTVTKLGLAPIQRDDLEYEFQVVAMIDMEHRIDVGKTRAAPLAGLSFPANKQSDFAQVYREWLDGGATPARQRDLEAIAATLRAIPNGKGKAVVAGLRAAYGESKYLTDEQIPGVWAHLSGALEVDPHRPLPDEDEEACLSCLSCLFPLVAGWHTPDGPELPPASQEEPANGGSSDGTPQEGGESQPEGGEAQGGEEGEEHSGDAEPREPAPDTGAGAVHLEEPNGDEPSATDAVIEAVRAMDKPELVAALRERDLATSGNLDTLRHRLAERLLEETKAVAS